MTKQDKFWITCATAVIILTICLSGYLNSRDSSEKYYTIYNHPPVEYSKNIEMINSPL